MGAKVFLYLQKCHKVLRKPVFKIKAGWSTLNFLKIQALNNFAASCCQIYFAMQRRVKLRYD